MSDSTQPEEKAARIRPFKRWSFYLITLSIIAVVVFVIAQSWFVAKYGYKTYKISSAGMAPALLAGDQVITFKITETQNLKRKAIVIFPLQKNKPKDFVKRIVGLPGEKLEIRRQKVYINGGALEEPYANHTQPAGSQRLVPLDDFGPLLIPEGHVFVLGDNRENNFDSRHFGVVEIQTIAREVHRIYWSWNSEESSIRWTRIGKVPE